MLDSEQIAVLGRSIRRLAELDRAHLQRYREQARALRHLVRPIRPRNITAISLMATDAGENFIQFDPYLIAPVRVVDSYGKPHFLDALSPYMSIADLNAAQFEHDTPLGILMRDLDVPSLWTLSRLIPSPDTPPEAINLRWVQVYRDLAEWAVLYKYLVYNQFATDTMLVRDGYLRSLIFNGDLFARMWERIRQSVEQQYQRERRRIFVVGLAKRSKVLDRYLLALHMEGVLVQQGACYAPLPRAMEEQVYRWTYYGRAETESGEPHYKVVGALHFAKFGHRRYDPIYVVDVWLYHQQRNEVDEVFSYLLADAQAGFPTPFYPLCLQKAHEQATLSGLESELLQDLVLNAIRDTTGSEEASALEAYRMLSGARRRSNYER
ncbi:MAG: hypothetical protein NZ874_10495 [Fimbriimonadales bacterium]|nr:hypothetical protein [Fimbriimonadales bacterium]